MKRKTSMLAAGLVTTLGVAGAVGLGQVSAETSGTTSLVDKIAQKFNLNKDEVQAVFDADQKAHEAEREEKVNERLSQAVKDGKITERQKALILQKMEEIKADRPEPGEMKDLTEEEHEAKHEEMKQKRQELEAWAKENDIPTEYLMFGHGGPRSGHRFSPDEAPDKE